jgi:hypothetical protein
MIRIRWPARRTLNSTSITGSFRSLKTTKEPTSAFAERQTSFQALPGHEHYPPAATGRVDAIEPYAQDLLRGPRRSRNSALIICRS